jgi:hypothetical protein
MLKVASLAAHRRSWRGCSSLLYLKTSPKMKIESVKAERKKKYKPQGTHKHRLLQ